MGPGGRALALAAGAVGAMEAWGAAVAAGPDATIAAVEAWAAALVAAAEALAATVTEGPGDRGPVPAPPGPPAIDRVGEIALAVATVMAVVAVGVTLPALPRRARGRTGLTPALVIVTGGAAITFVAYLAFTIRCEQSGCGVSAGDALAGIDPWWRDGRSWEWGAQLLLASVALVTSSLALALAARELRGARPALLLARLAYFTWVVLVFALPLVWELFVI